MKIVRFSVTNYRSITTANKIRFHDLTVLVGKNNEGKSNFLRALNIAMSAIIYMHKGPAMRRSWARHFYDWKRDFPIQLQSRKSGLESIFKLDFQLDVNEVAQFHELTGLRGNEIIPIAVRIGKNSSPKIDIPKKGSSAYKEKKEQIAEFISQRITFNYIQAVRTENMAKYALEEAIYDELAALNNNPEYINALDKIQALEQNALKELSTNLVDPLKVFLPTLKDVSIERPDSLQSIRRRHDIDVIIDDGIPTSIDDKGDGIKSLVTLAILQDRRNVSGASVVAIEEPESHLHSGAIHRLSDVIQNIANSSQVIITTHNPLFVSRNRISSNIIVDSGTVRPAKDIADIREVLGVLPSDNLQNARFVLVVEGENDKIALMKILPLCSKSIASALRNNLLIIKPLGGATNLSHDLLDLKTNLCQYAVLLDNDKAGHQAAERAINTGLIDDYQIRYSTCKGLKESEFEDCIKQQLYKNKIENEYKVDLKHKVHGNKNKWSDRMKELFEDQGIYWNERIEKRLKEIVSSSIPDDAQSKESLLITQKSGFIDGLVDVIESMLDEYNYE